MIKAVFTEKQIEAEKEMLRKKIFFALLIVDPNTKDNYPDVDVDATFADLQDTIAGVNEVFGNPIEIIDVAAKIAMALKEFHKPDFEYKKYRKFILDAGNTVMKIGG